MSTRLPCAALALLLGFAGLEAHAQSMDYGAFEQLFGEPVTSSATGSPQRMSDVPVTMEIVTAEQIRRSGAYDIPGVLRHVLGVDFQQWTDDQAEIGIRGYNQSYSQRVLVLVDGRQVYADYYSFTPWSALPVELDAIRQIEVVMGPSSALFGFNAVGGVINIITYSPLDDTANSASVRGGTQELAQGSAVATLRSSNAGLRISGGASSDEDFSTPVPAAMNDSRRVGEKRQSVDLDGEVQLSEQARLGIEGTHTHVDENQLIPTYQTQISQFTTDSVRVQLSSDTPFGLTKTTAYGNWIDEQLSPGVLGTTVDLSNRLTAVQFEDIVKVGTRHALRAAIEYRDDSVGTVPIHGGRVFYHVLSASGMWEWKITPSFSWTNAARFDDLKLGRDGFIPATYPFSNADWDRSLREFSFNSGAVWRPDAVDTLRLTTARGVLLPNLGDFGALLLVTPQFGLSGSPTVSPSVVTNYEASWNRSLSWLAARLTLRAFYQDTTAVPVILGPPTLIAGVPYALVHNVGSSEAAGAEFGIDGVFQEHWRWGLNARLESVTDHFDPAAADGTAYVDYQHVTPAGVVNASLGWAYRKWEMDVYLQYQSHTSGLIPVIPGALSGLVPVPAYVAADARIAYKVTERTTVAVSGQNLTHSSQRQTSGAAVERRVFVTLAVHF